MSENLNTENRKTLVEKNWWRHKWGKILCSWIGIINIIKMSILLKVIYTFYVVPIKIPMAFFTEIGKQSWNMYGTTKDPKYPKKSGERRKKLKVLHFLVSNYITKLQYIKITWRWHRKRFRDQRNRLKSPEMHPHTQSTNIWWQGSQAYSMGIG